MSLVTIAIASYNNGPYIDRCVESVINQSHKDLEILIVDDGSTDDTLRRLDEFNSDKRINIIKKENGGLSSVRQKGLENSKGEFICFIDADDYLLPQHVELMAEQLIKDGSDVCVCSTRFEGEDGIEMEASSDAYKCKASHAPITTSWQTLTADNKSVFSLHLSDSWNKMYRVSSIRQTGVKFHMPKGLNGSDTLFNMLLSLHALKYSIIEEVGYVHVMYKQSAVHRKNKNLNATYRNIISDIVVECKKLGIWKEMKMKVSATWYLSQMAILEDVVNQEPDLLRFLQAQKDFAKEQSLMPCSLKMSTSKGQYLYFFLFKYALFLIPLYLKIKK